MLQTGYHRIYNAGIMDSPHTSAFGRAHTILDANDRDINEEPNKMYMM